MNKKTIINLRIEDEIKKNFFSLCEGSGYDASKILYSFIEECLKNDEIPYYIIENLKPKKSEEIYSIHYIKTVITSYLKEKNNKDIEKVYLFGSYARSEQNKYSDINLHIEIKSSTSLFLIGSFKEDLSSIFNKNVEVIIGDNLTPIYLDDIKKDEICIYERSRQ